MHNFSEAFVVSLEGMRENFVKRQAAAMADADQQMAEACREGITHLESMILRELTAH